MKDFEELLQSIAHEVIEAARDKGLTVATAESLTAGMTAAALGGVPGASAALRGGAVTYCDEIKHKVLGVGEQTLDEHTAVSVQTAREMAAGARKLFDADIAVSLTGFAGPDGGTKESPAGTVYIATCDKLDTMCRRCHFEGSRNEVRLQSAQIALEMVLNRIEVL